MALASYQKRVVTEAKDLGVKLTSLTAFLGTDVFGELSEHERDLLLNQHYHMQSYLEVLHQRIHNFHRHAMAEAYFEQTSEGSAQMPVDESPEAPVESLDPGTLRVEPGSELAKLLERATELAEKGEGIVPMLDEDDVCDCDECAEVRKRKIN